MGAWSAATDDLRDLLRLDRSASPRHAPAEVEKQRVAMRVGAPVTMIGFGSGLPAKIDTGGTVVDASAGTLEAFRATTDAFGGNSGSGVFDINRKVVLARGDAVMFYNLKHGCDGINPTCVDSVPSPKSPHLFGPPSLPCACLPRPKHMHAHETGL